MSESRRSRRPRRAVRPSGTVGSDESVLRSALPAPAGPAPGPTTGSGPVRGAEADGAEADGAGVRAGGPRPAEGTGSGPTALDGAPHGGSADGADPRRTDPRSGPQRAITAPVPADDLWRTTRSADDSDVGWGDTDGSNDERLRREKPPHW